MSKLVSLYVMMSTRVAGTHLMCVMPELLRQVVRSYVVSDASAVLYE